MTSIVYSGETTYNIRLREGDAFNFTDEDKEHLLSVNRKFIRELKVEPFRIDLHHNIALVNPGYVGVVRLYSKTIVIEPRFPAFNFQTILKMWLIVNSGYWNDRYFSLPEFEIETMHFLQDIARFYVNETLKVSKLGIVRDYIPATDYMRFMKGRIDYVKTAQLIQNDRTVCHYDDFSQNILVNQIVLYCLQKLLLFSSPDKRVSSQIMSAIKQFRGVNLRPKIVENEVDAIKLTRRESHYRFLLDLSKLVIKNASISDMGDTLTFWGFLVDYNKLFEDFVKLILWHGFQTKISWWKEPKDYASYTNEFGHFNVRRYIPDILYLYDSDNDTASAVIDVKNKMPDIFDNPDVFQITFYCKQLRSTRGILVYPSGSESTITKMNIWFPPSEGISVYALTFPLLFSSYSEFERSVENFLSKATEIL
ncbi:MAG: McrC family protein [Candidatus Thorarchaeota archaeon]